ncbi:MAG: YgiT-type zinc finger protein [Chloroflexota bacterium]
MTETEAKGNEGPKNTPPAQQAYVCPECHAGLMRLEYLTYFTWLNQELITVPNFPSWVCDICGRREYDERAITWLNTLLQPNTGRKTAMRRRNQLPGMDRPLPS